ncbi:MAG: endonuclease MutS2 [Bacillota bacterium]
MHQPSLEVLEFHKIKDMVADEAKTFPGKTKVRKLKPYPQRDQVEYKLAEAGQAAAILGEFGRPPLLCPEKFLEVIQRAEKEIVLKIEEINHVERVLRSTAKTSKFFQQLEDMKRDYKVEENRILDGPILNYNAQLTPLPDLIKEINKIIDENNEIKDTASSKLKNIRQKIVSVEGQIRNKLDSIIRDSNQQKMLQDSIITRRDNRFVVPVKQEYKNSFSGIIHDQSSSGLTLFMEPVEVVKLNNNLRELKQDEKAEIHRILRALTLKIGTKYRPLRQNFKLLVKLDEIFARAGFLRTFSGSIPSINSSGYINIQQGRHPLLGDSAVPIDIFVGGKFRTLLITGPNTGGKTVALKTLGLFVVMASSGIPLPADSGTRISIFASVFADIGDEQSIEQNLSTFSSHMNKIKTFLTRADKNSLVLLDEIGAGTDPREGAALGISVLDELKKKDAVTVATTHYSQLKSYAYSNEGVENASVEFDLATLSPTYRLIMGVPGGSNAFEIALRLGLPDKIIEQARTLLDKDELVVEEIIADLNDKRRYYEEKNVEIDKKEARLEKERKELEQKKERLEKEKDKILRETREQAEKQLRQIKARTKRILSELKNKDFDARPEVDRLETKFNLELKEMEDKFTTETEEESKEVKHDFQPGDQVRINSLSQTGEIIEMDQNKEEATVQAGIMQVTVDLADLSPAGDKEEDKSQTLKKYQVKKNKSVSNSLDLRGKRYEEAQKIVDKYLDDAFLAGLTEVEIIHGKGSGALREAVGEVLESSSHVKSYRIGGEGEGGLGVTIAKIGR